MRARALHQRGVQQPGRVRQIVRVHRLARDLQYALVVMSLALFFNGSNVLQQSLCQRQIDDLSKKATC